MNHLLNPSIPQASEAGLPPVVRGHDDTDTRLQTRQLQLTAGQLEMTAGQAGAQLDTDHDLSQQMREKLSQNLTDQLVSAESVCYYISHYHYFDQMIIFHKADF